MKAPEDGCDPVVTPYGLFVALKIKPQSMKETSKRKNKPQSRRKPQSIKIKPQSMAYQHAACGFSDASIFVLRKRNAAWSLQP